MTSLKKISQDLSSLPNTYSICATITTLVIATHFQTFFTNYIELPLIFICIFVLGVPHGAIDHIVFYQMWLDSRLRAGNANANVLRESERADSVNTKDKVKENAMTPRQTYYINYFAIMAAWWIMWKVSPTICLFAFLLNSCYHFGQSDLHYLAMDDDPVNYRQRILENGLYLSRGLFLISSVMTMDRAQTNPVILKLSPSLSLASLNTCCDYLYRFGVQQHWVCLGIMLYISCFLPKTSQNDKTSKRKWGIYSRSTWAYEWMKTRIIWALFTNLHALTAFAVYFGCWHSCESIIVLVKFLKGRRNPVFTRNEQIENENRIDSGWEMNTPYRPKIVKDNSQDTININWYDVGVFYELALGYTLVSMMGMWCVYLMVKSDKSSGRIVLEDAFWPMFNLSISVLTGPHVWVMGVLHRLWGV